MALQHLLDAAVEPLHHSVGLGRLGWCKAVLDLEGRAERVELMRSGCRPLAQAEEPIRELLAVVGKNGADADWAGAFQIPQEAAGVGRSLGREDADEDPAGRPVNGHEEVAAAALIGHLRQVFHVDVDVTGLVGLEGAVLWLRGLGFQIAQIAHTMSPQAAVQPGTRGVWIKELAHNGQQVIQRDQQRLAQGHHDGLLRRRQRGLKPVRRVAAILDTVSLAPFIDGLRGNSETFRKRRSGIIAGLDCGPDLRRRCRLLVKINQHGGSPSRSSLRTDLAMNRADRRGEM